MNQIEDPSELATWLTPTEGYYWLQSACARVCVCVCVHVCKEMKGEGECTTSTTQQYIKLN